MVARWRRTVRLFLLGMAALATGCSAEPAPFPSFAVRVVDDRGNESPPGRLGRADRVPLSTRGIGTEGALWLQRDGGFDGPLIAETHVATGADGQPVVAFTFTPEGAQKFAALTRANLGRRLAIVVNGTIVATPLINGEAVGETFEISGYYTEAEARELAADLLAAGRARE